MGRPARRRRVATAVIAAFLVAAAITAVRLSGSAGGPHRPPALPRNAELLLVGQPAPVHPIRPGFLGLSFEYRAIGPYAGSDPSAIDPVFLQLIRDLTPGQAPVIRVGGDTTDHTWWPVQGMLKPHGMKITLRPRWLAIVRRLAQTLDARLILGVNLESDSPAVAGAEARAFVNGIGRRHIYALEPGNEPELYPIFTYYLASDGTTVYGRARHYDIAALSRDFTRIERVLPAPVAGPTIGAPKWFAQLGAFLSDGPRVNLITLHRYPLQLCFSSPKHENYPTIAHLLDNQSSFGRADSVIPEVALAHARGLQLRVDEMNTISCGYAPRVGYSFATALWAINALFAMAQVGVDGVNIHSFPKSSCSLFAFTHVNGTWRARVEPEYYGLLMFSQAAPPGSHFLRLSGPATSALHAWATRASDGRIRVVLINDSATERHTTAVRIPGTAGPAMLERLQAPSLTADRGVTLGGATFGASTTTGRLSPTTTSVHPTQGDYVVAVHPASAALLTLPPSATH